jgi:8-oxo-dGTP diphosphatase
VTDKPIAAAIITDGDRVLMIRRRVAEGELSWAFPSGGVEEGETASEAAVREVKEETGLTVEAVSVLGSRVHPNTGRHMSYVACRLLGGVAAVEDADELAEVEWVTLADIPQLVPYGLYGPVQRYLDEVIGGEQPAGTGPVDSP